MGTALTADATGRPYRDLSLWFDQLPDDVVARPGLVGDVEADVVVVGAGLTGLWTAYYLTEADPGLDVVVVEQETAGYGASGRNGGWCSALFPAAAATVARRHGDDAARALRAAMRDTVVEVGGVAAAEGIECDFRYGGSITLARTGPQLARARAEQREAGRWGDDVELWSAATTRERLAATSVLGATFTPDCARVQPARLVRGLADVVQGRGVRVVEQTTAVDVAPGAVRTRHLGEPGSVRAQHVVLAAEAWTSALTGPAARPRSVAPVYSLMIATEPLPAEVWEQIGLRRGETFGDHRHLIVYGRRTEDDRLAFGGRGAPYHWGSSIRPGHDREDAVFEDLLRSLVELFPVLHGVRVSHRWGGPLGVARDWHASVGLDASGVAWAGGYVGDGVATTNLAGRTLADLLLGRSTELTRLPWVGHRSPRWEPEPWRWLGMNAGLRAMTFADAEERLTGRPSVAARVMRPLLGH